jgi:CheY-like chemotaxis protein
VPQVLVLDDEAANRLLLKTLLESRGHDTLEAANALDALRLLKQHRPALIIFDLSLPGMDGADFVKAVRLDPELRDVRLALYTGSSRSALLDDFMATCGIGYFLPKPGEPEEVLRIIDEALSRG